MCVRKQCEKSANDKIEGTLRFDSSANAWGCKYSRRRRYCLGFSLRGKSGLVLPPLLEPITVDENVVTFPITDSIDHNTFAYRAMGSYIRGTFNWRFDYKEREISVGAASA